MKALIALAAAIVAHSAWAADGVMGSQYQAAGTCGPFPRAQVTAAQGYCVGIVAGADQGLKMPRTIVEWRPGQFILTDMGGWVGTNGRVLALSVAKDGKATVTTLFSKRHQPHGLSLGPDGKVYVGEKGRVSRFDPHAPGAEMELVADSFPDDGLHPLTNLIFLADGALVVNVGAPTDRCETKEVPKAPQNPCPLTAGDQPRAALWKLTFDKPGGKVVKTDALARGLRNSMALAVDPQTGTLIQGENGVDLPGEDEPVEELNVIVPGKHYGWPFCAGKGTPMPGFGVKKSDCAGYEASAIDLPAHSAPLGMLIYNGAMFPALKDKLVIALHGYRKYGHRIVAIDTKAVLARDQKAAMTDLVSGWNRLSGIRPLGGPAGLTVASDGAIWFVEDKNRTVMVLLKSSGAPTPVAKAPAPVPAQAAPPPKGWNDFVKDVVKAKCTACHVETRGATPEDVWAKMAESGWVGDGAFKDTKLVRALSGVGPEKPMPPPSGLKADPKAKAAFERLLGMNP